MPAWVRHVTRSLKQRGRIARHDIAVVPSEATRRCVLPRIPVPPEGPVVRPHLPGSQESDGRPARSPPRRLLFSQSQLGRVEHAMRLPANRGGVRGHTVVRGASRCGRAPANRDGVESPAGSFPGLAERVEACALSDTADLPVDDDLRVALRLASPARLLLDVTRLLRSMCAACRGADCRE
ncbi:hypothetical protein BD413DRAFT_4695 [Trametes elegans]|nr:hypothetical protein BD413DRAFT_4695 [Trametes elegans]